MNILQILTKMTVVLKIVYQLFPIQGKYFQIENKPVKLEVV